MATLSQIAAIVIMVCAIVLGNASLYEIAPFAIGAFTIVLVTDNGVGPALEAPAHLNIFARAAYYPFHYTFHRRFREFFVPCFIIALVDKGFKFLRGERWPSPIWRSGLMFLWLIWLLSLGLMRIEASKYRNQPWGAEEARLWTEGMTRREFLQRERGSNGVVLKHGGGSDQLATL
jgi:hypothetical protein